MSASIEEATPLAKPSKIYTISKSDCLTLLAQVSRDRNAKLTTVDAGVWNNVVLKAETNQGEYYYKQYRDFDTLTDYSPPTIPKELRAQIARRVQMLATASFTSNYQMVPAIIAHTKTSFLMEAVPNAQSLHSYLVRGTCPKEVITTLPRALAKFHNHSFASHPDIRTLLDDTTFRDYKLELQYEKMADIVGGIESKQLLDFVSDYKQIKDTLLHGDINSRNILVTEQGTVHVIDFEQAHLGSSAYDLSFILSELYIASRQYKRRSSMRTICTEFVRNYFDALELRPIVDTAREATTHLAAQILYRFEGPSRHVWTGHIDQSIKAESIAFAKSLLRHKPQPIYDVIGSDTSHARSQ